MKLLKIFWVFLGLKWNEVVWGLWKVVCEWKTWLKILLLSVVTGVSLLLVVVFPTSVIAYFSGLDFDGAIAAWYLIMIGSLAFSFIAIVFKRFLQSNWKTATAIVESCQEEVDSE